MGISKILPIVSSIMIFLLSALGLFGWIINNVYAKTIVAPGIYSVSPYSSIFLLIFAVFLLWQTFGPSKLFQLLRIIIFMAIIVFSFSIVINFFFGFDLHLDQLFFSSKLEGGSRMLFSSAICFLLFGTIFLLINNRIRTVRLALQVEIFFIMLLAIQGIIFPILDLSGLFLTKFAIPMSLPIAFSFIFLAIGVIAIRDDFEVNIFFRKLLTNSSTNRNANGSLLLGLFVLLVVSLVSYVNTIQLNEAANAVSTKLDVIRLRYRLILDLVNAETAQRGYLLTNDGSYLFPYAQGLTDYTPTYQNLLRLAKSPKEVASLQQINNLAQQELSELTMTIKLRNTKGVTPALQAVMNSKGEDYMGKIRQIIDQMGETDQKEYVALLQTNSFASDRTLNTIVSGSLVGMTIVILAIILLNKRQ